MQCVQNLCRGFSPSRAGRVWTHVVWADLPLLGFFDPTSVEGWADEGAKSEESGSESIAKVRPRGLG